MNCPDIYKDIDFAALYAAGAASVASMHGMSEKDAESFAMDICKAAASRRASWDDDEEDTFWNRNKSWMIPTIVGAIALHAGASGERFYGRKDRSDLSNAGSVLWKRVKELLGVTDNPTMNVNTKTSYT